MRFQKSNRITHIVDRMKTNVHTKYYSHKNVTNCSEIFVVTRQDRLPKLKAAKTAIQGPLGDVNAFVFLIPNISLCT
jgi:hypothetical protein